MSRRQNDPEAQTHNIDLDKIETLSELREQLSPPPKRGFSFKKTVLIFFIVFFVVGLGLSYKVFSYGGKIFRSERGSFFGQVKELLLSSDREKIEKQERVNILVMGMRGLGHTKDNGGGTFLSDTNIIFSFKPGDKQASMLSLPRDLLVDLNGYGGRKINAAYALKYNETKDHDKAAVYAKEVFEKVTGLKIDYYVKIDFVGFEKIIDVIGGVDIKVDRGFTDNQYPGANYGYQVVSFEPGWEHMNGDRALKYVRSRHGNNGEGSDFARAARQQKILTAVKNKLLSFSILLNPGKIDKIASSLGDHVRTDLALTEAIELAKLTADISGDQIVNKVVDHSNGGLLHSGTTSAGAYVLIPNAGENNFSEIQALAKNILNEPKSQNSNELTDASDIEVEGANTPTYIQIQNGTTIQGLAGKIAKELEATGFQIISIGNANSFDFNQTMIYDYTDGAKNEALKKLKATFKRAKTQDGSFYPIDNTNKTDFVIVLGQTQ